jgi:hypothetical protein
MVKADMENSDGTVRSVTERIVGMILVLKHHGSLYGSNGGWLRAIVSVNFPDRVDIAVQRSNASSGTG